jgi:hypothetical protein
MPDQTGLTQDINVSHDMARGRRRSIVQASIDYMPVITNSDTPQQEFNTAHVAKSSNPYLGAQPLGCYKVCSLFSMKLTLQSYGFC